MIHLPKNSNHGIKIRPMEQSEDKNSNLDHQSVISRIHFESSIKEILIMIYYLTLNGLVGCG